MSSPPDPDHPFRPRNITLVTGVFKAQTKTFSAMKRKKIQRAQPDHMIS